MLRILFYKKFKFVNFLVEKAAVFLDDTSLLKTAYISQDTPLALNDSKSSSNSSLNLAKLELISPVNSTSTSTSQAAKKLKNFSTVCDDLHQIHKQAQIDLLKQLLKLKNLSYEWFDVILPLVWKCVDLVRPDVKHDNDSMDIRNYIKIKKLPGVYNYFL